PTGARFLTPSSQRRCGRVGVPIDSRKSREAGMAWFRRAREKAVERANMVASRAAAGGGKAAASVISSVALLFSGFSLWETSLKQAALKVKVRALSRKDGALTGED